MNGVLCWMISYIFSIAHYILILFLYKYLNLESTLQNSVEKMSEYSDIFNLHFRYKLVINFYRILQNSVAKLTVGFFLN